MKVAKSHEKEKEIRAGQIRETLGKTFVISRSHLRSNSRAVQIGQTVPK